MNTFSHRTAADLFTRLASVVTVFRTSTANGQPTHLPAHIDPSSALSLPLPIEEDWPAHQPVAFVNSEAETGFHRTAVPDAIRDTEGHTRVYESLDARTDGWHTLVAAHLAHLLRYRVVCTAYQSRTGDQTLGPHYDTWTGLIIHINGAKSWTLWPHQEQNPKIFLTHPGDVLIIPRGVFHDVTTPPTPGHSTHITFAITQTPLGTS
ncbi:JmjC domain-containing protein [Streptomyces sp. NPDC003860]